MYLNKIYEKSTVFIFVFEYINMSLQPIRAITLAITYKDAIVFMNDLSIYKYLVLLIIICPEVYHFSLLYETFIRAKKKKKLLKSSSLTLFFSLTLGEMGRSRTCGRHSIQYTFYKHTSPLLQSYFVFKGTRFVFKKIIFIINTICSKTLEEHTYNLCLFYYFDKRRP